MTARPQHGALENLVRVARALGPLRERVVFIGGAIAPLLQTAPPFKRARPTTDVDAVLASTSYTETHALQEALREAGFAESAADPRHAHRWLSPDGIPFDLVPAGEHLGAAGGRWDRLAAETPVVTEVAPGLLIRHAGGPTFLTLKWAAYHDRGRSDPYASRDLEDLLALLASRPSIIDEARAAPPQVRAYLARDAQEFVDDASADDLLAAHLNNAEDPVRTIKVVRERLQALARLA